MYRDLASNLTTATTTASAKLSAFKSAEKQRLRTTVLYGPWALFALLVALGIHGSSTGVSAAWWSPDKPYTGYLFNPHGQAAKDWPGGVQNPLMNKARRIRSDEFAIFTPFALSQLAQKPAFPVINRSFGFGQNMLVEPHTPVWHISTLARPATWGYFLFGAQRGLSWFWWFQIFGCFTVLFLLFEIALSGDTGLAAFGSFWFCASAYVVCWSQWPAHVIFFAGLGCVSAYNLLASETRVVQIASSIFLGLSIPGFVMIMYPPWQVAAGYFFVLLFVVLFIRDRMLLQLKKRWQYKLGLLALSLVIAGILTGAWIWSCLPALRVMANTTYPGRRFSTGGDYSFALLFKGIYNLGTIYRTPPALGNQSEAASFYYLFPAVFAALLFSGRVRRSIGLLGWSMVAYIIAAVLFLLVGIPGTIAKLSLLSYVPAYRADLTIGLASIILCALLQKVLKREVRGSDTRWEMLWPWLASFSVVLFFVLHSLALAKLIPEVPVIQIGLVASFVMGCAAYFLLAGRRIAFCVFVGSLVVATTALFNPLATNLDHVYKSELAKEIEGINNRSEDHPLWLCYGGWYPGQLVAMLGGRSLSGVHWPPQLSIWQALDTFGAYADLYNQYAEVSLHDLTVDNIAIFNSRGPGELTVWASPHNPVLKSLGARYVLLMDEALAQSDTSSLNLIYRSTSNNFSIFEIP